LKLEESLLSNQARQNVTELLLAWSDGDEEALDSLIPLVYDELRRNAAGYLRRERAGHTLQPTALVHEVYVRLVDQKGIKWQNRAQFFGIAATVMRRVLVDNARRHSATKRGGLEQRVTLDEGAALSGQREINLLALDDALKKFEQIDPPKSRIVELRFFGGLSIEETAEVTGLSPRTVDRQWQLAKAWLHREIGGD
jgi:RNA polymerase sigma factor (TIGR02999 family)